MTQHSCEQIARIIEAVFYHESDIDPRTVALMFEYIGRLVRPTEEGNEDDL